MTTTPPTPPTSGPAPSRVYTDGRYAKIRAAELVATPPDIAHHLRLPEDDSPQVIRRDRTTYTRDDHPYSMSVSWFDGYLAERAPLLLRTERIPQGTVAYIVEQTGQSPAPGHLIVVGVDVAITVVAHELGLDPGAPVLVTKHWYFDEDGEVIEYGESITAPGFDVRYVVDAY